MKEVGKFVAVILLGLLALSAPMGKAAWANAGNYRNYGHIALGINGFEGDLDDADYDAGLDFKASYGRYLTDNLVIEGSVDYFFSHQDDISGSTGAAGAYSREDYLGVGALLATLKAEIPAGPVTLYGGGGVGLYYAVLRAEIDTTYLGDLDVDDDDTVFGLHLVTGGYYNINQHVFVGFEGMYRWTDDLEMRETIATVPVRLKGNLDGYTLTMSAGFRF